MCCCSLRRNGRAGGGLQRIVFVVGGGDQVEAEEEDVGHNHTGIRLHSAPSLVHPRLPLLPSRLQPSRFGLARHHQS